MLTIIYLNPFDPGNALHTQAIDFVARLPQGAADTFELATKWRHDVNTEEMMPREAGELRS